MGMNDSLRNDDVASLSAFLSRQLEILLPKVYERKFPTIMSDKLVSLNPDLDEGAESITYQIEEAIGAAKIISSYSDEMPRITVTSSSVTQQVKPIALGFEYTVQEVRAGQLAGRNLADRKMVYAFQQHLQLHDRLVWVGDTASGVVGLTSHPNVPRLILTNTWGSASTGDQILAGMNLAVQTIINLSNGVESPNTLVIPSAIYSYIASTPRANTVSDKTILDYFKTAHPEIDQIVPIAQHLDTAGTGGGAVAILYNRAEINVDRRLCMAPKFHSPQPVDLNFKVPGESRHAGVAIYYPFSALIIEGIS